MRKYLDLIGSGGVIALVAISVFDLYATDKEAPVQPVMYQPHMPCAQDAPKSEDQACNKIPSYKDYNINEKKTIDIGFTNGRGHFDR